MICDVINVKQESVCFNTTNFERQVEMVRRDWKELALRNQVRIELCIAVQVNRYYHLRITVTK